MTYPHRLLQRIDKAAKKVQGAPEKEIDSTIDEAAGHALHHRNGITPNTVLDDGK
jgi:hypothetical protein